MTPTTKRRDGRTQVEIREPAQLISAIPCLLGFRPADAIVLIGLGGETGHDIDVLVRLDLPGAEAEVDVAETVTLALSQSPGRTVLLVVVGRHPDHPANGASPPHRDLVERLAACVRSVGCTAEFAAWVPEIRGGARWHTYWPSAADGEGVLPDESSTVIAAVRAVEGHVTFESREEMARQLQPDVPAALDRRAQLLRAAADALSPEFPPEQTFPEYARVVRAAIDRVRRGELSFTDDQVVRLAMALSNPQVRDSCLLLALPPRRALSRHAQRLWLELVRLTPAPERAEPAALLGHSAYMHGDGPLALVAFDNALEANPGHYLTTLLRACLERGVPPVRLHRLNEGVQDLYRPRSLTLEPSSQNDP
ncbi:MAG TPA: DUF4192 domain-containing protein [Amycolatopsis sp.]|nr:DUF4192 domain-containing protein [Amycolatopsis sp.]